MAFICGMKDVLGLSNDNLAGRPSSDTHAMRNRKIGVCGPRGVVGGQIDYKFITFPFRGVRFLEIGRLDMLFRSVCGSKMVNPIGA